MTGPDGRRGSASALGTVNDLRDKRLVILDESKLSGLEIVRKPETLQFAKNSRSLWQFVKPQPFRTDAVVVDELLSKVKEAKFDPALSLEDQKKNAAENQMIIEGLEAAEQVCIFKKNLCLNHNNIF